MSVGIGHDDDALHTVAQLGIDVVDGQADGLAVAQRHFKVVVALLGVLDDARVVAVNLVDKVLQRNGTLVLLRKV